MFAGYLASVDTWMKFSDEWDELLTISPRMKALKMSAMCLSSSLQMERTMFHYRVIEKYPVYGIGCAIPIEPLKKIVKEFTVAPMWANPYYLAWRAVVTLAIEASKRLGLIDPIEFVFDKQSDQVNVVKSWANYYATVPIITRQKLRITVI
jgi:hypothetical protein